MYCRNCGVNMPDQALICAKCGTPKGEGANYCQHCGFLTTEKTEHCRRCGAKQTTKIPQRVKNEKIERLAKSLKRNTKLKRIFGWISVGTLLIAIAMFAYMALRPEPANIPEFGTASMTRVGDTYFYDSSLISDEVAEYWVQGRELLMGSLGYLFISFATFICFLVYKHSCKVTKKKLQKIRGNQ